MKRLVIYVVLVIFGSMLFLNCSGDDNGPDAIPLRDRSVEALDSQERIETYLETHFYNYEEFQNPGLAFDFKIKFDTIAGDNAEKTPLMEQVSFKMVPDRVDDDVEYKLYYLNVIQGEGEEIRFPDIATIEYEGIYMSDRTITDDDDIDGDGDTEEDITIYPSELFDSSEIPTQFDLTQIVNGLQDGLIEFNTATNIITNPDGSLSFEEFGVGAVFIPSGLGYYAEPPPSEISSIIIPVYAQLFFTFQVYNKEEGDQDQDGIPSIMEDRNGNGIEEDDDNDQDGIFDMFDPDDDNDGRPTRDEIEIDGNGNITFPDVDGDGKVDYLDSDS